MDRALTASMRYRNRLRRGLTVGLPVVVVGMLVTSLSGWLRPTLARVRIRTAEVTVGSIEAVITATGLVTPEVERVLSSPLDARVLRILKRPGAIVNAGDPVVELDTGESVLALETILKDLDIKANEQAQARLALDKSLADLDGRIELKDTGAPVASGQAGQSPSVVGQGSAVPRALPRIRAGDRAIANRADPARGRAAKH